ncbi:MAG: carboxypeptidase regulatory-like domain-containing protein [Acidobacteriota bacterium]
MNPKRVFLKGSSNFVLILFSLATFMWGQGTTTTSLTGAVTDPQGAFIPGATLHLINMETDVGREVLSDDAGRYQFAQVPPGLYKVEVEVPGFKKLVQENIELLVNTPTTLDLSLALGEVSEVVVVSAETSQLNTTDATIGNAFNEMQVLQLPLEGRNPVGLLSLQPGVNPAGEVNGSRRDQNNITLDGVDVNDQQAPGAFESVLPLTLDAVQEFRVTTSNPTASQGRSSGGQVVLVTKSGSNDFHGSIYEFHRNTKTTANDFFNNSAGLPRPALLRNVFGASFGGPIKKDRAFFFVNFERRTDRSQTLETRTGLPTQALRNGTLIYEAPADDPRGVPCPDGSGRNCGILTPDGLRRLDPLGLGANPAVQALWNSLPQGNDPAIARDLGLAFIGLRFNAAQKVDRNTTIARFDYDLLGDGRHMLFWRGNLADFVDQTGAPNLPGQPPSQFLVDNSKGFVAGYTAQISPILINDFRGGFTRQGIEATGGEGGMMDAFSSRSFVPPISFNRAFGRQVPVYNFVDDVTWLRGKHTIQAGINFRFIHNNRFTFGNSFVSFRTNNGFLGDSLGRRLGDQLGSGDFANFPVTKDRTTFARASMALLGLVNQASGAALFDRSGERLPFGQPQNRNFGANEYEWYLQDTWKIRPNFSIVLGVRYLNSTVPYERKGFEVRPTVNVTEFFNERVGNALKGIPSNATDPLVFDLSGAKNNRPGIFSRDKNNWAPRVSLAWSPNFGHGVLKAIFGGPEKSSIRAGYSLTYDRTGGAFVVQTDLSGAVGLATNFITDVSSLGFGFPDGPPAAPRFQGFGNLPPVESLATIPTGGFPTTLGSSIALTGFGVDTQLKTPYTQSWNLTWERQLPKGYTVSAGYVGRVGHRLLQKWDLAAPVNLVDPGSGTSYWNMVNGLLDLKQAGQGLSGPVPFIENVFPDLANSFFAGSASENFFQLIDFFAPSYSDLLFFLDARGLSKFGQAAFFQQQFNSLPFWRSKGNSSFNSFQLSVRKRFSDGLQFDLNYTLSHSIDDGSAIENAGRLGGQIANAFAPRDFIASSGFDVRHNINLNWLYQLPFGHGRALGSGVSNWVNQVIGGWEITGIFRRRSGLPLGVGNGFNFPTNFFLTGPGTQVANVETDVSKNVDGVPNLFADPDKAIQAFDFTRPGSSGTRNPLRGHRFITLDFGLNKRFFMPWEGHSLQFRWEVFNATNTVSFAPPSLDIEDPSTFGRFTGTAGPPRVMQFALRYEF